MEVLEPLQHHGGRQFVGRSPQHPPGELLQIAGAGDAQPPSEQGRQVRFLMDALQEDAPDTRRLRLGAASGNGKAMGSDVEEARDPRARRGDDQQ